MRPIPIYSDRVRLLLLFALLGSLSALFVEIALQSSHGHYLPPVDTLSLADAASSRM